MKLSWWHWVVFGFLLLGAELVFPSFTIAWLGLSALVMAVIVGLFPDLPHVVQFPLWIIASSSFTILWYKYLKPKNDCGARTLSIEVVGERGIVVRGAGPLQEAVVRVPLMKSCFVQWHCVSEEPLEEGETVEVTGIEGELLRVSPVIPSGQ